MRRTTAILFCGAVCWTLGSGCLDETATDVEVLVPLDGASKPNGDGASPMDDASGDDVSALPETCNPATPPTCLLEGQAIDCGMALTWRQSPCTSPREWCEAACAAGGGEIHWDWPGPDVYLDNLYLVDILDLSCDDCCLLPYAPSPEVLNDGNPCTADACAGDTCTHVRYEWIGTPCENRNDFGTCTGLYTCDEGCGEANPLCLPTAGHACSATVAIREVADGVDNDCDGAIDEAPDDAVFRFTGAEGAIDPSIVALDDGRLVAAWRLSQEWPAGQVNIGMRTPLFVQVGTYQDPVGGVPIQIGGEKTGAYRLFPLPGGRFAFAWQEDGWDADMARRIHVRVLRSPADPPIVDEALDCARALRYACRWPDGSFAFSCNTDSDDEMRPPARLRRYDADGTPAGDFVIDWLADLPTQWNPEAALAGDAEGRVVAAWSSQSVVNPGRMGFWARWFDADGTPLTDAFELTTERYRIAANRGGPFLAPLDDGRMLVAWSMHPIVEQHGRIRARILEAGALPIESPALLGTTPDKDEQILEALDVVDSTVIMTWLGSEDAPLSAGVYVTRTTLPTLDDPASVTIRLPGIGALGELTGDALDDGTPVAMWRWWSAESSGSGLSGLRLGFPEE